MRCSVIEIGSNTVKCTIYDITGEKGAKRSDIVLSQSYTVGLINYIHDGTLSNTGKRRLADTVSSLVRMSKNVYSKKIILIATAGLRMIQNCSEAVETIKKSTGYTVNVISGKEEASLGFAGLKASFANELNDGISIDLGGGSTEIVKIEKGNAVLSESIDVGALKLFSDHIKGIVPDLNEIKTIADIVDEKLKHVKWLSDVGDTAYIVGGSGRALSSICADIYNLPAVKNGFTMSIKQIGEVARIYSDPSEDDIRRIIRIMPDRLHMTIPGIIAYSRIFKAAGTQNIVSSFSKLRDGYVIKKLLI